MYHIRENSLSLRKEQRKKSFKKKNTKLKILKVSLPLASLRKIINAV